ncbi:MAG TPA: hypothetical protein PKB11_04055 [Desulfovibrio sp.]|uniref:hypothetical protein n=1 Tax=Desulfovibrio sp. TaxID=885 RepID=UPI002BDD3E7A|nr:hypothetical protein [Desulfovibrio sp.]HMM37910.1 hypothetical protein [Desulfovibrio sp.]
MKKLASLMILALLLSACAAKNPPQEGVDNNKMDDVILSGPCKGMTNGECLRDQLFKTLDTITF